MKKIKNVNGYAIYQAGERDVKKYGFTEGDFYVYFASDVKDFGLPNSTPEFENCGSLQEAEDNCTGNFAIAKEIVEGRTTAASVEEILEVEAMLDAGADPETLNDEPDTIELTIRIGPEQAAAIVEVLERAVEVVVEVIEKVAVWAVEVIKKVAAVASGATNRFMDAMLSSANDHPKWWHLYKHAKKYRTRKKYRRRLMQQLLDKLEAATSTREVIT